MADQLSSIVVVLRYRIYRPHRHRGRFLPSADLLCKEAHQIKLNMPMDTERIVSQATSQGLLPVFIPKLSRPLRPTILFILTTTLPHTPQRDIVNPFHLRFPLTITLIASILLAHLLKHLRALRVVRRMCLPSAILRLTTVSFSSRNKLWRTCWTKLSDSWKGSEEAWKRQKTESVTFQAPGWVRHLSHYRIVVSPIVRTGSKSGCGLGVRMGQRKTMERKHGCALPFQRSQKRKQTHLYINCTDHRSRPVYTHSEMHFCQSFNPCSDHYKCCVVPKSISHLVISRPFVLVSLS